MRSALPPLTHLLYLHGFRSSPQSFKAQWMARWVAQHRPDLHWACPQLGPSPATVQRELQALTANWPDQTSGVIGSSLGGFYATDIVQRRGWRAVVINPAVDPARDLSVHIGRQTLYHAPEESFHFRPEYIAELAAMTPAKPLRYAERLLAIVATGDEVLDWREMAACHAPGPVKLVQGSDHGLSDFEQHVPDLLEHLGLGAGCAKTGL